MKVAFIIFDGMTLLDFVGVYDPVTRLKTMNFMSELTWEICAPSRKVADSTGLVLTPTQVGESLENFDMIIVPGGHGARKLVHDNAFIEWLRTGERCKYKVSVCTGALLLGAAGFLENRKATTHSSAFDELKNYCSEVIRQRIVDEGDIITAGGVTASIDLGLYLCGKLAGHEAGEEIRWQIEYEA